MSAILTFLVLPGFENANVIRAEFEKQTDLRTRGRRSQTDLVVHLHTAAGDVIIGVEGKVDEAFGKRVAVWHQNKETRAARLRALCAVLDLEPAAAGPLRYQLPHRTVAGIFEAQAHGFQHAVMLVHSFSPAKRWLGDFQNFAIALGVAGDLHGHISAPIERAGIKLRLGWISDEKQA